jgi:cell division cycle 20, cofactor of APC complex
MDWCQYNARKKWTTTTSTTATVSASGGLESSAHQPPWSSAHPLNEYHSYMASTLFNMPLGQVKVPCCLLTTHKPLRTGQLQPPPSHVVNPFALDTMRAMKLGYDLTPPSLSMHNATPKQPCWSVPTVPFRRLDATHFPIDFYLNVLSWSAHNILAIVLGPGIYLWNATTKETTELIVFWAEQHVPTSLSWCPTVPHLLGVGTSDGRVLIFDTMTKCLLHQYQGHHANRVSTLSWRGLILSAAGGDGLIVNYATQQADAVVSKYKGHHREVCGLEWDLRGQTLASGGNDCRVCLWDARFANGLTSSPRLTFLQHNAAIKALAWCPYDHSILASGAGNHDRTVKLWNASSGAVAHSVDSHSQVSGLSWNVHKRQLFSSHGYHDNQIIVWDSTTMQRQVELKGHSNRILSLVQSPDGHVLASAGADQRLCFWRIQPQCIASGQSGQSQTGRLCLNPPTFDRQTVR